MGLTRISGYILIDYNYNDKTDQNVKLIKLLLLIRMILMIIVMINDECPFLDLLYTHTKHRWRLISITSPCFLLVKIPILTGSISEHTLR